MKTPEELSTEIVNELLIATYTAFADTHARMWLEALPQFECPICGGQTIFKSGCGDHDEEGSEK